jgi:hypothetical protein
MASGSSLKDNHEYFKEQMMKAELLENMEERLEAKIAAIVETGWAGARNREEAMERMSAYVDYQKVLERKKKEQKAAAGGSLKKCAGLVGCRKKGQHRCTGCFLEIYCSKACQQAAWPGHKASCKEVRADFLPVVLLPMEEKRKMVMGKRYYEPNTPKSKFAVRVTVYPEIKHIEVNNEDCSVMGKLVRNQSQQKVYDKLWRDVQDQGVDMGLKFKAYKAFYYAIYKGVNGGDGHRLEINVVKQVAMADW